MEGVPEELFQFDQQTFPREDPKITELREKQRQKEERIRKQEESERERERKKEAAQVKKVLESHGVDSTGKGSAGGAKKKAIPQKPNDDGAAKRRQLLCQKIRLYWEKLGHKLQGNPPKTLPKGEEQLEDMLAEIEGQLCSNGGIEQAGALYIGACMGIEKFSQSVDIGFDLAGPRAAFAATVAQNKDQWQDLVTEVAISNAEWVC